MNTYLVILTAYLIGAIPFALLVGKMGYSIDVREHGSGNLGTTNTFRVLGKKAGIIVLFGDMLKGTLAACLPLLIETSVDPLWLGVAAVIGHCYPVYARFNGGKAVATSAGVLLAIDPIMFVSAFLVFALSLILFHMVSLSSLMASIYATAYALSFSEQAVIIAVTILMLFIVYRHRTNIKRILKKEEPKVFLLKRKK